MEFIKKVFKNFIELTRLWSLPATIASFFPILAYSQYSEKFLWFNFILLFFAIVCVHLGTNVFDDYIDTKSLLKKVNSIRDIDFNCFGAKARLLKEEIFSLNDYLKISCIFYLIAILIGVYFAIFSTPKIIIYAGFGAILSLFYPISAKYYLSEIILALIWGPLMINGGYLALTGEFNISLCILSFAIAIALIVFSQAHFIMDWEFDIQNGKKTLAILAKNKPQAIKNTKYYITLSYIIVVLGVFFGFLNPKTFAVFLTLPIATKLLESLNDYINIKDVKFEPRWYWGFFENFEALKEQKIDFYMFRVFLGRNYLFFFALFASLGTIL